MLVIPLANNISYFYTYTQYTLLILNSLNSKQEKRSTMEKQPSPFLAFLFFLIVSCYIAETHAKKQEQRLGHLYKAKLKENSGIDTSLFKTIHNVSRAKIHSQDGLKENDRIEKLPGQPEVQFSQYGGYVTVDKSAGRAMYYYFVEALKSKDSAPLLLWLNGGKCLMP